MDRCELLRPFLCPKTIDYFIALPRAENVSFLIFDAFVDGIEVSGYYGVALNGTVLAGIHPVQSQPAREEDLSRASSFASFEVIETITSMDDWEEEAVEDDILGERFLTINNIIVLSILYEYPVWIDCQYV